MKKSTIGMLFLFAIASLVWGCGPSVSVRPAGSADQFEVTVTSDEFGVVDTQELLDTWHEQARASCNGGNYRIVTRDFVQNESISEETTLTGIIECH